jgi:magnesium chelatase family protein
MPHYGKVELRSDLRALLSHIGKPLGARQQTVVMMQGPTGGGKVRLARRLSRLVPAPKGDDLTALYWLYQRLHPAPEELAKHAPFRAPHWTISRAGLTGSLQGNKLYPGELSLAHAGTLLLDEAAEYSRLTMAETIAVLRRGHVLLSSRAHESVIVPAKPVLIVLTAAACPCGQLPRPKCLCSEAQIHRYAERLEQLFDGLGLDYVLAVDLKPGALDELGKRKS